MRPLAIAVMLTATPALGTEPNRLDLSPAAAARAGGNILILTVDGARNGAADPGALVQQGTGNEMALTVRGDDTLLAVEQIGDGNIASLLVSGTANRLALSQHGTGNIATISQTGTGNTVAIRQAGR